MRQLLIVLCCVCMIFPVYAQDVETVTGGTPALTMEPSGSESVEPLGRINPRNIAKGGQWNPRITVIEEPPVPGELDGEKALIQQKTEAKRRRMSGDFQPEFGPDDDPSLLDDGADNPSSSNPIINESWQFNSTTLAPPDNAIGISAGGKIVSSFNTRVVFHETDGTETFSSSLADFFSPVAPNALVYDPRVIYMSNYDRFAIVVCNGTTTTTSRMFVAFSTTNDPMDPWWFYSWNGTTCTNGGGWFDFPSIGASADLYVSGNLFGNGGGFQQCILRQINLSNAFTGGTVSSSWWCDVEQSNGELAFTIKPLSYAYGLQYGPGMVLANTRPGSANMYYYYVTQNQGNSPVLNTYSTNVGNYSGAGAGAQLGSSNMMDTGGARMRDGFYANGTLYTVWNIDRVNGESGIRYVKTNFSSGVSEVSTTFGGAGMDYAYPAIQPWGTNNATWNGDVVIAFLRTSPNQFPQFRAVFCDNNQNFSGSFLIKAGESPIVNGTTSRWGDYIEGRVRVNGTQPEVWFSGQYGLGNGYGNWNVQLVEFITGCTNPSACNYNPNATQDDGSCETASCTGCMNPDACNYNPNATISGLCLFPGCTQSNACNYSWLAGCDDGSCCFDNCVRIQMEDSFGDGWNGGTYTLTSSNGDVVATGTLIGSSGTNTLGCIDDGCYTFSVTSGTFPDEISWELEYTYGNFLFGGTPPFVFADGGAPFSDNLTIGEEGEYSGCTDPLACNYNPDVECDDGSCCYQNCLEVQMTDSFGDGWNGNVWEVFDPSTGTVVDSGTLENGSSGVNFACLTPGCYIFRINVDNGIFSAEVGWSIIGADDGNYSGGSGDEVSFIIGGGAPNAGCTDNSACNFDFNADCDDGSCCYDICGELILFDSFGDGWNGAVLSVFDENDFLVASTTMSSGSMETQTICLGEGCYTIGVTGGTFPSEVSWFMSVSGSYIGGGAPFGDSFTIGGDAGCTDATACNYNAQAFCDDESCVYPGCIDPSACNFDIDAVCDDASCSFDCYGCTYGDAENYDASASMDDGTCIFECDPANSCQGDLNNDGAVNTGDLTLFLAAFGTTCS